MKRFLLLSIAAGLLQAPASAQTARDTLAITNVNVVDVRTGQLRRGQTILIAGDRIARVDAASRIRTNATTLDGSGKYVIPGLWDMHAHLTLSGKPTEIEMPLFIANGVTGVRVMNADCRVRTTVPMNCLESHREWQTRIDAGELLGPRLVSLGSWPVNGPAGVPDSLPAFFRNTTAEHGRDLARYFKERGVDFIKVYNGISRDAYFALAAEARTLGLPFAGHEPAGVSAIEISNAGQRSLEHSRIFLFNCYAGADSVRRNLLRLSGTARMRRMVDEFDPRLCADVFRTFARNRTWITPTHVTRRMDAFAHDSTYRTDARMKYIPQFQRFRWNLDARGMVMSDSSAAGRKAFMDFYQKGLELTGAAFRAGVPVILGTDAGDSFVFPGFSVHDELIELTRAGLTAAESLRAATLRSAEFADRASDFGTVEPGRFADLVLLDANPLENISNSSRIHAVIRAGRVFDRAALDRLLAGVEAVAK